MQPRSDFGHIFALAGRLAGWGRTSAPTSFEPVANVVDSKASGGDTGSVDEQADDMLPPAPDKPIIRIVGGQLPEILEQCEGLVRQELYINGNVLTKVGEASVLDDGITRDSTQPVMLRAITPAWVCVRLTELATFQKYDMRMEDWKTIDCPNDLATKFIERPEWPKLRPLDAIVSAPFVREDGSVCDDPGYDRASQAIYAPNAEFPTLPATSTRDDAAAALDILLRPFAQFPYATGAARAAFAAHILTEAARLSIDRSPMFWYTAPTAGTGKTLLSCMPAMIVHGHEPASRPWPRNEEELRKTLFSSLISGDRSIAFDNLQKGFKLRTAELCAFITSEWWKDRKLGVSEVMVVRNRSVISISGNNVTPVADMARRSLVIRLDANTAALKERTFDIADLRTYVSEHRVELLIAALTILKAYAITPDKVQQRPLPSFEQWSARVRDALLWLGMADPAESQEEETDDEINSMEAAFNILGATFGGPGVRFTAADVVHLAGVNDALNGALLEAGCAEPQSRIKVGYWLRDCRDQICAGFKLKKQDSKSNAAGAKWFFSKMAQPNGDLA